MPASSPVTRISLIRVRVAGCHGHVGSFKGVRTWLFGVLLLGGLGCQGPGSQGLGFQGLRCSGLREMEFLGYFDSQRGVTSVLGLALDSRPQPLTLKPKPSTQETPPWKSLHVQHCGNPS